MRGFVADRWRSMVGALVVLVTGGYVLYQQLPDVKHQLDGYSFEEVLPKAIDAVGGDARVVSVLDRNGDVSFQVLSDGGRVLERFYGQVCTSSPNGPGSACAYRETHGDHRANGRELELAKVRLGDLDAGIVARLRRESGTPKQFGVGLRRARWIVAAPTPYVAYLDGSNLHRAGSPAELELVASVLSDPGAR